tara:strand:- start:338 stop:1486 length:1149 start_codon:yes stop_codon:yes gene_type:complete
MLSSSASRLSKAYLCGKMAQPYQGAPPLVSLTTSIDSTSVQADGNLRHALMEFYLNTIASQDLTLDGKQMKAMAKGENWDELYQFLESKNGPQSPLGNFSKLDCRKKLKKLRKTVNFLSKELRQFGEIKYIVAERSLKTGSAIQISDSVEIKSGEIDAVFVLENVKGKITVIVVDWKRSLSNKGSLEQYKRQCQVYIRCIKNEPSLLSLSLEQIKSADIHGFLFEVGGDEGTTPDFVKVDIIPADIDAFLEKAAEQYESTEATSGTHCSSWCRWAFADEYCRSITPDALSINFHSDSFWTELEFHSKWINSLTQFTTSIETVLEPGGKNVIHFNGGRELQLKNVNFHKTIPGNRVIRAEGSVKRQTSMLAYMHVKNLKVLHG